MAEVPSFVGTEFGIFGRKPKQSSTVETIETIYRPIASVDRTGITQPELIIFYTRYSVSAQFP
jgi:hypothetical protein